MIKAETVEMMKAATEGKWKYVCPECSSNNTRGWSPLSAVLGGAFSWDSNAGKWLLDEVKVGKSRWDWWCEDCDNTFSYLERTKL